MAQYASDVLGKVEERAHHLGNVMKLAERNGLDSDKYVGYFQQLIAPLGFDDDDQWMRALRNVEARIVADSHGGHELGGEAGAA